MTYRTPGEKTGKRNLHYNRRHRIYGSKMKMYDLDSVEYHHETREPVAMVETKFGLINNINLNDDEFTCLFNTARKLEVPFFCLVYYPMKKGAVLLDADESHHLLDHMQYLAIPVNQLAYKFLPKGPCKCTEKDWVEVLYKLRGLTPQPDFPLCSTWKECPLPKVQSRL